MAMITCPECKKKISETADSCPNCGYQLTPEKIAETKKKERQVQKGCGIGCLSVIVFFVVLYMIGSFSSDDSGNKSPDKNLLPREVDGFYIGEDMLFVGMSADDCFAILAPDDVVRQKVEKNPNDEDSYIVTKLYRKWGKEFEIQLTVAKRGGPYSINKIVILKE